MTSSTLLNSLANPPRPNILGGFRQGQERKKLRDTNTEAAELVKNQLGFKYAKLAKLDAGKAVGLAQVLETNNKDRLQNAIGLISLSNKLLQSGAVPPQEVGQLLAEQAQQLSSQGISTDLLIELSTDLMSGDPAKIQAQIEALAQLDGMFTTGKFSARTEILEDGSSVQTTTTGQRIVKDPSGNVVTGKTAAAVVRAGAEEGIRIQTERAGGRREATEVEKRASSLIERGLLAAESTAGLRRGIELLDTIKTGGINAITLATKQRLGIEGADQGELTSSLGKAVLSQLRETFGSAFTEGEGDRLDRIEANIGKSSAANKRLLTQALKIAERTTNRAIKAAKARGQDDVVADLKDLLEFSLSITDESEITKLSDDDLFK